MASDTLNLSLSSLLPNPNNSWMPKGDLWGNILSRLPGPKEFGGKVWADSPNGADIPKAAT